MFESVKLEESIDQLMNERDHLYDNEEKGCKSGFPHCFKLLETDLIQ